MHTFRDKNGAAVTNGVQPQLATLETLVYPMESMESESIGCLFPAIEAPGS
jgi:hypothetical protein